MNTEIYTVNIRIQSKWRKISTRKTPNTDDFHAEIPSLSIALFLMDTLIFDIKLWELEPRCIIRKAALYDNFDYLLDHFRETSVYVNDDWFFRLVLDKK